MKITWLGHAKVVLQNEDTTMVIDPYDESVGYPMDTPRADVVAISHGHHDHNALETVPGQPEVISAAGKYRIGSVKVGAVSSFHDGERGALRGENLIFVVEMDGLRIGHLGDLGHLPDEDQRLALRDLDVMFIPVGGNYTIDAAQALEVISMVQPRIAVAMHYKTDVCGVNVAGLDALEALCPVQKLPGNTLDTETESFSALSGIVAMAYR
ncbi:MAG: MBL fold metallo-hydrolase [Eubacteriales bacterium]|nr:MBL fold metallo-hydrolase [Eubacteriales bacterium]